MLLADTKILTTKGMLSVGEIHKEPDSVLAMDGLSGEPFEVIVAKLGHFPVSRYELTTAGGKLWGLSLPRPCKVPVDSSYTYDLRAKDLLQPYKFDCGYDAASWASGFMFRHGIKSPVTLYPDKYRLYSDRLKGILKADTQFSTPIDLPSGDCSAKEKGSFVRGYLAADGNSTPLKTPNKRLLDWFCENALCGGIVVNGRPQSYQRTINNHSYTEYVINWCKALDFKGFKVAKVVHSEEKENGYLVRLHGKSEAQIVVDNGLRVFTD